MKPTKLRDSIVRRCADVLEEGKTTQVELAELSGLTQSTISMGITGYRPLNRIDVLDALYEVLPRIERRKR